MPAYLRSVTVSGAGSAAVVRLSADPSARAVGGPSVRFSVSSSSRPPAEPAIRQTPLPRDRRSTQITPGERHHRASPAISESDRALAGAVRPLVTVTDVISSYLHPIFFQQLFSQYCIVLYP